MRFDRAAWTAAVEDASAFDALAARVGLGLTHAAIWAFAREHLPRYAPDLVRRLVEIALDAIDAPAAYAFVTDADSMRIALIIGDQMVLGYRGGTNKAAWKLPRWSKDPIKNRPMLEAWAASKTRARDTFTTSVKRAAAP